MPDTLPQHPDFGFFNDPGDEADQLVYPTPPETVTRVTLDGYLPENDIRRAFVAGAKWWEFHETGATMWPSDRNLAEAEAEKRYPGGTSADWVDVDLELLKNTIRAQATRASVLLTSDAISQVVFMADEIITLRGQLERARNTLIEARRILSVNTFDDPLDIVGLDLIDEVIGELQE